MSRAAGAQRLLSTVAWGTAILAVFTGVATLRAVLDGERELAASDAAFDANDLHAAIQHARRAASAYAPGAPHVERGYQRLRAVARGAEATGQTDLAVLAWHAERASVLESASFFQPFPERLEEANRNLARLSALGAGVGSEPAQAAPRLFKLAQARSAQRFPAGALLALGLLLSGMGLGWFAARALGPQGRIEWSRGRWGIVTLGLGASLWALGAFYG